MPGERGKLLPYRGRSAPCQERANIEEKRGKKREKKILFSPASAERSAKKEAFT